MLCWNFQPSLTVSLPLLQPIFQLYSQYWPLKNKHVYHKLNHEMLTPFHRIRSSIFPENLWGRDPPPPKWSLDTWGGDRENKRACRPIILHYFYSCQKLCFKNTISRKRIHVSIPVFMSLHSWWHESPARLLQTPNPNLGHLYSSLNVCVHHVTTVCMDEHSCLPIPPLYDCRADSYMWYFACMTTDLYIERNNTQEAPRCHGTKRRRWRETMRAS